MSPLVVLVTLVCLSLGSGNPVVPRGYHGTRGIPLAAQIKEAEEKIAEDAVPETTHPYFAGILIDLVDETSQSVCGGALVSYNRLVTAAHCWSDGVHQAERFNIVLGSPYLYRGGMRVQSDDVVTHPDWTPTSGADDVAVVYLPVNLQLSPSLQAIKLADQRSNSYLNERATAVGFGVATSDHDSTVSLNEVSLQVVSEQQCSSADGSTILPSMLCASGAGRADTGGPLVINKDGKAILIGVASFASDGSQQQTWSSAFARSTNFFVFVGQHLW